MSDLEKLVRTILGVLLMMVTMISLVWCLYKYAQYQERKKKQTVLPMVEYN